MAFVLPTPVLLKCGVLTPLTIRSLPAHFNIKSPGFDSHLTQNPGLEISAATPGALHKGRGEQCDGVFFQKGN